MTSSLSEVYYHVVGKMRSCLMEVPLGAATAEAACPPSGKVTKAY